MKELQIPIKWLQAIKEGADFISEEGVCHTNESLTFDAIPPRSYAFVSDTAKLPAIIPIINGVDLLYHEATFSDEGKKRAKQTGHTTASQAAEIAKLANVQKLIIGHFSHRYKSLDGMLDEARAVFPNTFLCEDGMVFNVE